MILNPVDVRPKLQSKNCVVCILAPILTFGRSVGFAQVTSRCPHSKNAAHKPEFLVQQSFILPAILFVLVILLTIGYRIYILTKPQEKVEVLKIISELFYCSSSLFLLLTMPFLRKHKLVAANAWAELCADASNFGFSSIISPQKAKKLKRIRLGHICSLSLLGIMFFAYYISTICHSALTWKSSRELTTLLSILVQITFAMQFNATFVFVAGVFENTGAYLCHFLLRQNPTLALAGYIDVVDNHSAIGSLDAKLRKVHRILLATIRTINYLSKYFGFVNVVWLIHVLLILIVNIYMLIGFYRSNSFNLYSMFLEIKTHVVILTVSMMLTSLGDIPVPGEDIQSFLFRYPISKLSQGEAAQVEMLINTLSVQKPVLKASDIFTVGTRLIASITGTVVTYVLVALQFKASWTKE